MTFFVQFLTFFLQFFDDIIDDVIKTLERSVTGLNIPKPAKSSFATVLLTKDSKMNIELSSHMGALTFDSRLYA